MPERHTFVEWFERYQRESPLPMSREDALSIWNSLLDIAIEDVAIAKDNFVFDGKYEAAGIAKDVQQLITEMKLAEGGCAGK